MPPLAQAGRSKRRRPGGRSPGDARLASPVVDCDGVVAAMADGVDVLCRLAANADLEE